MALRPRSDASTWTMKSLLHTGCSRTGLPAKVPFKSMNADSHSSVYVTLVCSFPRVKYPLNCCALGKVLDKFPIISNQALKKTLTCFLVVSPGNSLITLIAISLGLIRPFPTLCPTKVTVDMAILHLVTSGMETKLAKSLYHRDVAV